MPSSGRWACEGRALASPADACYGRAMSRLAQWQTWATIGAVLTPILVIGDLALFERNRALQAEVAGRQQQVQRGAQIDSLQRDLLNAIATLATRNNDAALRAILTDHGLVPNPPAPPPAAAPAPGRGR
jgi:hypothetical protein